MTYKHTDFGSSEVMRSLEKIAIDKGLVKESILDKLDKNPKKADLSPSDNLAENILKLCTGLRETGFDKYADELEEKFVNFKIADVHMYRAIDEDGEDLIDFAHPDGDVTMAEATDHHGDFHTITSRHKKILDVLEKKPTGKLACEEILGQCKIVIGQATTEEQRLQKEVDAILTKVNLGWAFIDEQVKTYGKLRSSLIGGRAKYYEDISNKMKNLLMSNPDVDELNHASQLINNIKDTITPGPTGGVDENAWVRIKNKFAPLTLLLSQAVVKKQRIDSIESDKESSSVMNPTEVKEPEVTVSLDQTIDKEISSLNEFKKKILSKSDLSAVQKQSTGTWLSEQLSELNKIKESIKANPATVNNYSQQVQEIIKQNQEFNKEWVM